MTDQTDMIETTAEYAENAALPQLHEVHTDPCHKSPSPENYQATLQSPQSGKSPARWAYERRILYIQNFEEQLDSNQQVAMGFTGGDAGVIRIEGMGYFDPDILTFYGTDGDGTKTHLIQHVGQLNVMLRALPVALETETPTRIGFELAKDLGRKTDATG